MLYIEDQNLLKKIGFKIYPHEVSGKFAPMVYTLVNHQIEGWNSVRSDDGEVQIYSQSLDVNVKGTFIECHFIVKKIGNKVTDNIQFENSNGIFKKFTRQENESSVDFVKRAFESTFK